MTCEGEEKKVRGREEGGEKMNGNGYLREETRQKGIQVYI